MVVKLRAGTLSVGHQITNKGAAGESGLCHTFRALNETFKEICGLIFMLLFWNDQKKKMDVYVVIILLISPLFFYKEVWLRHRLLKSDGQKW